LPARTPTGGSAAQMTPNRPLANGAQCDDVDEARSPALAIRRRTAGSRRGARICRRRQAAAVCGICCDGYHETTGGFHDGGAIGASLLQGRPEGDPSGSGDHRPGRRPPGRARRRSGTSFWLLGTYATQAAVPSDPGLSIDATYYSAGASAGRSASFARGGRIEVGLDTASNYILLTPTYTFEPKVLGGQFAFGVAGSSSSSRGVVSARRLISVNARTRWRRVRRSSEERWRKNRRTNWPSPRHVGSATWWLPSRKQPLTRL
jgi:hypothetical protein